MRRIFVTASTIRHGVLTLGTCSLLLVTCREPSAPDVPPVTTAPAEAITADAGAAVAPVAAAFVDVPAELSVPRCSRLMIAVAKGKVVVGTDTLGVGDVLVVTQPEPVKLEGSGVVLSVTHPLECEAKTEKTVVRATTAPELRWAKGAMSAHLDVPNTLSPDVYLGRLEGTANVAEHEHSGSWEILAGVEASGTFVIDGTQSHVGPRQITFIPPGVKHAWRPDPGTKLVAIQMYAPPGPEQRFVALSAAEKDAGSAGAGK